MPYVALFFSLLTLFLTIWIIVPAPHRLFWLISIITGEWSLYFGLFALLGIVAGIFSAQSGATLSGYIAISSGAAAMLISLYPLLTTWPVASSHGASLSIVRYFKGTPRITNIEIQTHAFGEANGEPLMLDVYYTPGGTNRPAVVVVHGGSWNGGTRSDFPDWNHWLVDQGYTVFDIDYRLTPQPNWQTATRDVHDAVRWIRDRADQFGIDPKRMALLGRSAGGQLALHAAYTPVDTLLGTPAPPVQAVVAFYAPADLKWGYENPAVLRVNDGSAQLRAFTGGTPTSVPEIYKQASPITYVKPDTPPTLLIHGESDQLVGTHHTVTLDKALKKVSNGAKRHQVVFIPYGQHGFDFNFNGWGSQVTRKVLSEHLAAHLGSR